MVDFQKFDHFIIDVLQEQQIKATVPCLFYDEERAAILKIILLKRIAIKDVHVSSCDNLVIIQFDSSLLSRDGVFEVLDNILTNFSKKPRVDEIKAEEFVAVPYNRSKKNILFRVEGMSCASCALFMEMVLSRNNEVIKVDIDYSSGDGCVVGYLDGSDVMAIIESHGYKVFLNSCKEC